MTKKTTTLTTAQAKAIEGKSVSDQIRYLDKDGLTRADIARALRKRYQHVRNVLEGDKLRKANKG